MRYTHKITIIDISKERPLNVNQSLQFFGSSLGLFGLRDKDRSCYRVFVELLKAAKKREGLTSDELAFRTQLTRGTAVYHLNKLMEAGIAIHSQGKYYLREESLQTVVLEMKKDLEETMKQLLDLAEVIDDSLAL